MHNIKFILLSIILLPQTILGQQDLIVNGIAQNSKGVPIPFASIRIAKTYGVLADSIGRFILKTLESDTLQVSCVGFETKFVLPKNQLIITLDSNNHLLDEVQIHSSQSILNTKTSKRILKNTYLMASNFIDGSVLEDNELENKQILSIKMKVGFIGSPVLHLRLNIKKVNLNGFPGENLLKDDVIIKVPSKFSFLEIDLKEQNIVLNESKVFIGLELLNSSTNLKKLNKNYTPIIGTAKNSTSKHVFTTNKLNKWANFNDEYSPYFVIKYR